MKKSKIFFILMIIFFVIGIFGFAVSMYIFQKSGQAHLEYVFVPLQLCIICSHIYIAIEDRNKYID